MSIPTITVTGHLTAPDGSAAAGTVTFTLNSPLLDAVGNVLVARSAVKATLANGSFSQVLDCTAGGDIQPTAGVVYQVVEEITGASVRYYNIALPSTLGSTVDLADLVPLDATGLVWTVPDVTPEQARDLIGSTLVAGTGVAIVVDDAADTVTLSAGWAAADTTLQTNITAEAAARAAGDTAEATARSSADTAEATARAAADTAEASARTAADGLRVAKAGDTMSGPLVLPGDAGANLQATPLQQVNALIATAVAQLVNGAPGLLDTLGEIAAALAADESTAATLATTVAGKLAKASNLSDLLDAAAARTNLGLGTAATHPSTDFDATGAAAAAQAAAVQRANHTGTQLAATVSDFTEAAQDVIGALFAPDTGDLDFTYDDAGNAESVAFKASVVSAFARTILDDADAAAVRATIGAQQSGTYAPLLAAEKAVEYLIVRNGAGAQAINGSTGAVDYSTATADHALVFQSVATALNAANGGVIQFKGQFTFATQLVIYPGIALVGQGPTSDKTPTPLRSATIKSTYDGAAILVTSTTVGAGGATTFKSYPYLANFNLFGTTTNTNQNLIQIDDSGAGGGLADVYLNQVIVMAAGKHGLAINSVSKVWIEGCYFENNIVDGINAAGLGAVAIRGCYIFGNSGLGINNTGCLKIWINGNRIWSNTLGGYNTTSYNTTAETQITHNSFENNGSSSTSNPQCLVSAANNAGSIVVIANNMFRDDRGASAVAYNLRLSTASSITQCVVSGNAFYGAQTRPMHVTANASNRITIVNNAGFNDVLGVISTPFHSVGHVGIEGFTGGTAAPVASTAYRVVGMPVWINAAGGTGVSITITDGGGGTVASALTAFQGYLPVGYSINFGAFSVAPSTMTVSAA